MSKTKNAVVLLSGGADSSTVLAVARRDGFNVYALTFAYGQRHAAELKAASRVAKRFGVTEHKVVEIDLRTFGGSALTSDLSVPKDRAISDMSEGIPITYVPARNTIFLSYALALAEMVDASDVYIGVNALDYSGYPDCRPEYIAAFEAMANLATKAGVEGTRLKIHTPLINLTKAEIVAFGTSLGVEFGETSTCYDPDPKGLACGRCDACQLRLKGFAEAGLTDPARYQGIAGTP